MPDIYTIVRYMISYNLTTMSKTWLSLECCLVFGCMSVFRRHCHAWPSPSLAAYSHVLQPTTLISCWMDNQMARLHLKMGQYALDNHIPRPSSHLNAVSSLDEYNHFFGCHCHALHWNGWLSEFKEYTM